MRTKEYLKNVMELEQAIYTMNKAIGYLNYSKKNLGICKNYQKPKEVELVSIPSAIISGILLADIAVIPVTIFCFLFSNEEFGKLFLEILLLFSILGGIIGFAIRVSGAERLKEEYENKLSTYNKLSEQDSIRVHKELERKKEIDLQINILNKKRVEVTEILKQLYDLNIIYPKYRNFVAVTTFYEYFESGRCNTLQGHEGAYNIYENEIRLNVIITKLDDIIERLDEIRSNQYAIHNAVCEGNRIANNIYQQAIKTSGKIDLISENSAITSYNSMITAKNTEIVKNIAVYNTLAK